jgi:glycosyltransferase involved in cell wall biosynthesis
MRVAYLVSRFPVLSETFIVRELDAVDAQPDMELELLALFPADDDGAVHPAARRWLPRVLRPSALEGLRALAWWLRRRPLRLLGSLALVTRGYGRRPDVLARALLTLLFAAAQARRLRALGVDHVHAHFATYPALGAWLAWRLTGVPYSFTAHAHDIFVHQLFLARKARDARFVVAISEYNRRFISAGAPESAPIHVVHCGVDPAAYRFRVRDLSGEGELRALCVAALVEYKGHRVLLDALAGASNGLGRIRLELVGGGELRDELEAHAARLGIADRVTFLGGRPEDEVRGLLERSDLFVLPSVVSRNGDMEGLPVALMEALASGLPTVSTRQSGIPELLLEGRTGTLAEPADPVSLRAALSRVLRESSATAEWAREGRRLVEAEFDIRESGRRMAALFSGH